MEPNKPLFRSDLLFDELTDGVCISDKNGDVLYMNPAAKRMLGGGAAEERTNSCRLLCGKLFADGSDDFAKDCPLRDQRSHRESVSFLGKHGPHDVWEWKDEHIQHLSRWRHLRVRCLRVTSPLWTLGVEERHFILIEDASAATELADRKEDWRRMVAHDLRSPLTNIWGTLRMLEDIPAGQALAQEETEFVTAASRACRRMIELLNLFLDVEQLDEGGVVVMLKSVPLAALLKREAEGLAARMAEKDLRLELSADDEVAALADEKLLGRVAQNLLDNAVKFSATGGKIVVAAARREDGGTEISIRDQGPGIPPQDLPFIFDRFYQAQARREGRSQGNGLGLTFCRQALQAMGGKIEARSPAGEGAEFLIRLPGRKA
jgi:signal transduction histidine kinase